MLKSSILCEIEKVYSSGGNLIQYMNEMEKNDHNSVESILISYDYQAGSYVSSYRKNTSACRKYAMQLANEIQALGSFDSILEAGVGEGTSFRTIIENLTIPHNHCYGFDLSWSRIKVAKDFLREEREREREREREIGLDSSHLFVAELSSIPLRDDSIDIVYTSHSIEPNGGSEKPILEELFRITKYYLVLFEPDYELADTEAKLRMESHGYCRQLSDIANKLGFTLIKHELLEYSLNALNPTSVIVIQKSPKLGRNGELFQCPITKTELIDCGEIYYSPQAKLMYPVIQGIPCLLAPYAILGSKFAI